MPVGTYNVTFSLEGFTKQQRADVVLTSGFTAPVNAHDDRRRARRDGGGHGETPTVDVQNARQAVTFEGDQLKELPTARNINSLLT